MTKKSITRRSCLRAAGLGAATFALSGCQGSDGGSSGGETETDYSTSGKMSWMDEESSPIVAPDDPKILYEPSSWEDDNSEVINHMTWAGYEVEEVQGPIEDTFNMQSNVELHLSDTEVFNRFESGEWNDWHHVTVDNAWLPRFAEAGLVRPMDYETWEPYIFDPLRDEFHPDESDFRFTFVNEEDWTFDQDGQLYGFPQRFGYFGIIANRDTVGDAEVADQGYDIAYSDEYDIVLNGGAFFFNMIAVMQREGINPFKSHSEQEIEDIRNAGLALAENASVLDSYPSVAQSMSASEFDIAIGFPNLVANIIRNEGAMNFRTYVPQAVDGVEQGVIWVETTAFVKGSHPRITDNYAAMMMSPDVAYILSIQTPVTVPHAGVRKKYSENTKNVLDLEYLDTALERSVFYEGLFDEKEMMSIWREMQSAAGS